MSRDAEFVAQCLELMAGFSSPVHSKRMFGGHGLFCEGLMFALIADGELYFKADDENDAVFSERDLPKFTYRRSDKEASLGYRLAPEEAFQDSRAMRPWLTLGWEAAVRADEAKPPSKRKRVKG